MSGQRIGSDFLSGLRRLLGGAGATAAEWPLTDAEYLERHYESMPGFSSRFSAEVAVRLLKYQQAHDIAGAVGEIGVLMGRSFIALALASAPGDACLAIDDFTWPEDVFDKFMVNCGAMGVDMARLVTIKANTTTLAAGDILARLGGVKLRFLHVDGGHTAEVLRHDLAMALQVMEPGGIVCLDDMLHAQYPELAIAVRDQLAAEPDFVVFCIVDRADLIAAAKYLVCRRAYAGRYQDLLRDAFAEDVFPAPAEFAAFPALILSKDARLVPHYRDKIEIPAA
jgi:predicted O-methyltransferase YrrM